MATTSENQLILNNSPAKIFAVVNIFAVIAYIFEPMLVSKFGSRLVLKSNSSGQDEFALGITVLLLIFSFFLLLGFKADNKNTIEIRPPKKLHFYLCSFIICKILLDIYLFNDLSPARSEIDIAIFILPIEKIINLLFLMTSMLLFASTNISFDNLLKSKLLNKNIFLIILTILVFLLEDLHSASRGNLALLFAILVASYSYNNPIMLKSLIRLRTIFIFAFLALFFLILTKLRVGDSAVNISLIYDSLLVKFGGNVGVLISGISGDLNVRFSSSPNEYLPWQNIKDINWFSPGVSTFHFFNSLPSFVNKYIFINPDFKFYGVYFDSFGKFPFNSSHYLLRFWVAGIWGVLILFLAIRLYFFLAEFGSHLKFFSYHILAIFSFFSFTGCALLEIPFILMPIFGLFFKRCFVGCHTKENIRRQNAHVRKSVIK